MIEIFLSRSVRSMSERRRILMDRMTEIPNRIMLSEIHEVHVNTLSLVIIYLQQYRIADYDSHLVSGSAGFGGKNRACIEIGSRGFGSKGHRCKYLSSETCHEDFE